MMKHEHEQVSVLPWLYWSLLPLHRLLLSLYFSRIVIQGLEHLPVNGPVVLAPKHFSRWDPVVIELLSLEPFWFMTNANQFEGVQGWFIRRMGAFPVDLARPKVSSFRTAIALLQAGKKLVLFPEGGIVRDQPIRPLKTGLARLVLQAEASLDAGSIPVVPIAIHYHPQVQPRAAVTLHIAPPLYSANFQQADEKQTAQVFTQALQDALLAGLRAIATR
ncbi:MAG: lysophospholipid acyltransferase family protein [Leptolyngbyaceae cyanobacterium bins.302]|nr:lysophospholipid acyltransferase family protein [Leptolyngbyaceae cyanobacterium bins.302]